MKYGTYTNTSQRLSLNDSQSHRGDPLIPQGELQHSSAQLGTSEYPHTLFWNHFAMGNPTRSYCPRQHSYQHHRDMQTPPPR